MTDISKELHFLRVKHSINTLEHLNEIYIFKFKKLVISSTLEESVKKNWEINSIFITVFAS